jgi:hypothetical protein
VRTIQVAPHGVWVEEGAGGIPREFALASVYPNPFNPTATVRVGLPRTAKLEAALYDLLGRRVAVLADGALPPGWHELTLDGAALPSGSYFVRVVVPGELNATRRVQLVR